MPGLADASAVVTQRQAFTAVSNVANPVATMSCAVSSMATVTPVTSRSSANQWPGWRELMLGSVQLWANRLDAGKLPVKPLGHGDKLWAWIGEYNPFVGSKAGVMPLLQAGGKGFEPL